MIKVTVIWKLMLIKICYKFTVLPIASYKLFGRANKASLVELTISINLFHCKYTRLEVYNYSDKNDSTFKFVALYHGSHWIKQTVGHNYKIIRLE